MIELSFIRDLVAIFGVLAGFSYYVLTVRNANIARKTQAVMNMSNNMFKAESNRMNIELLSMDWEDFEDFRRKAPVEKHAVLVDPARAFASRVRQPADVKRRFPVETNDLRLSPTSGAVDAGEVLPNINDGYRGQAPDLGAYEVGDDLPHYGPRPE